MTGLSTLLAGRAGRLVAATTSGVLWYLATGLEPWWWATWLAPIPLLLAAFRASAREAWALAVLAGLIGAASTVTSDAIFIGPLGSALLMLVRGLVSGVVVAGARAATVGSRHWLMVFVYPASLAAIDTLVAAGSPDGTIGSLAYSQMVALPVIQVAALLGAPAIVFVVTLFGALVTIAWHRRGDIERPWAAYGLPCAVILGALGYGLLRLAAGGVGPTIPVGLAAVSHTLGRAPEINETLWATYSGAVERLARQGARIVVLPEKSARLDPGAAAVLRARLERLAASHAVYLVVSVDLVESSHKENRAWLFAPSGQLIGDYAKHHLVPGFEAGFVPGTDHVVRAVDEHRIGLAICKDMDFPALGRSYSTLRVAALLVPAADFDVDAAIHARMAMLRGVEGGFTVIRSARRGWLTVSDRYGRIVDVTPSTKVPAASLVVAAPLGSGAPTLYATLGDVFGWLCVGASAAALLAAARRRWLRRPRGAEATA